MMINKRDLVIKLRRTYRELNRYNVYLRSIFFRTCPECSKFIEDRFTGVEETVDIVCNNIGDMTEEQLGYVERVLLNGEELDLSGKNISVLAHETSLTLYTNYLEGIYYLDSIPEVS
jgi:hypothetical protein